MDLSKAQRAATSAAYKSAEIIRQYFGRVDTIDKKGPIDLVTVADRESEKQIIATLKKIYPEHGILAEESGHTPGAGATHWVIDPLDGTTNFAHGLPIFAISIALKVGDKTMLGVILNPINGEFFSAIRGTGALFNGRPVKVTDTGSAAESLLATGFAYNISADIDRVMDRFKSCLRASRGIRRLGSAALDLCYLACGRFDGYWEQGLKPWDTAAGALIAQEAGAKLSNLSGLEFSDDYPELLATNGLIHEQLLKLLKK